MRSGIPSTSPGNSRGRRAALTAVLAGSLIAGGSVVATTVAAPASATPITNTITLQTGSTNQVTLWSSTGVATNEPLSTSSCRLTGGTSLTFSSPQGRVGLRQGSIGVINGGTGESCGQLNAPSETLTLGLGTRVASVAVLDVELQKNSVVLARLDLGTRSTYVELQSGESITRVRTPEANGGAPDTAAVTVATCQTDSSSAANSFATDNCRWVIDDALFSSITLKAVVGNVSLEGGADGVVTRLSQNTLGTTDLEPQPATADRTYFLLATPCPTTPVTRQITLAGGGTASGSTFTRLGYNADGSLCVSAGDTATQNGNLVHFRKSAGQPHAQYLFDVSWRTAAGGAELATTVDFELGGGPQPLGWCPSSLWNGSTFRGLQYATTAEFNASIAAAGIVDLDGVPGNGITQFACTFGKGPTTYDPTTQAYSGTEKVYVLGDIFIRRP